MTAVRIQSVGKDGTSYLIDLMKQSHSEGTIRIQSWKPGKSVTSRPNTDDTTKLYDIKATAAGHGLRCLARVFGPDPIVHFMIDGGVKVSISGALANNGITEYPLTSAERDTLVGFIAGCQFAPL